MYLHMYMYVSVSVILNGVFAAVVHPISLEARLQVTTKPGRSMDIPQALVQVALKQVTLAISRNQVQSDSLLVLDMVAEPNWYFTVW